MDQKRTSSLRLSPKSNLIPRDISESLGKLPPQAVDLEESTLGALMLERPALDQVRQLLKADHFYVEAHKEIFSAIMQLDADGAPIDMKTVVHKLRETGKIELVGGAYYIADLTSKVSSAANITWHAAVIVQMAIKREMILIASKIHHDAYEDDADAFELIDLVDAHIAAFKKNSIPDNSEARIKALWEKTLVLTEPPEEAPLITIEETPIVIRCNHTLVVGKKKSRKTLFIAFMIANFLKRNPHAANKVILFDTEQGRSHVWKIRAKIHKLTGLWVPIFYLRGMAPENRREFITLTCRHWSSRPDIIVIDGIRDCMSNINDPDESTEVIVWLEQLTLEHNIGVVNILHLNKTDNNARGHIGSELLNKAVCTIEMELDDKNDCTVVKCESARDKAFETFAFTHDQEGLPQVVGTPMQGKIVSVSDKKERLDAIFEDGPMKFTDLIADIQTHFACSNSKAKTLLTDFIRNKHIIKSGPAKSPDTIYKLISSSPPPPPATNGHHVGMVQTAIALETVPGAHRPNPDDLPF